MVEVCDFDPIISEFKINKLLKVSEITEIQIPNMYGIAFKNWNVRITETKLFIKANSPLNFLSLLSWYKSNPKIKSKKRRLIRTATVVGCVTSASFPRLFAIAGFWTGHDGRCPWQFMNKNINRYYPIAIGYKRLLPPTMVNLWHRRWRLLRSENRDQKHH